MGGQEQDEGRRRYLAPLPSIECVSRVADFVAM